MLLTALDILRPIAHVLVGVEHEHSGTWHVMLSFAFAHVVMCAVELVAMITDMTVLLGARHLVRYGKMTKSTTSDASPRHRQLTVFGCVFASRIVRLVRSIVLQVDFVAVELGVECREQRELS